ALGRREARQLLRMPADRQRAGVERAVARRRAVGDQHPAVDVERRDAIADALLGAGSRLADGAPERLERAPLPRGHAPQGLGDGPGRLGGSLHVPTSSSWYRSGANRRARTAVASARSTSPTRTPSMPYGRCARHSPDGAIRLVADSWNGRA